MRNNGKGVLNPDETNPNMAVGGDSEREETERQRGYINPDTVRGNIYHTRGSIFHNHSDNARTQLHNAGMNESIEPDAMHRETSNSNSDAEETSNSSVHTYRYTIIVTVNLRNQGNASTDHVVIPILFSPSTFAMRSFRSTIDAFNLRTSADSTNSFEEFMKKYQEKSKVKDDLKTYKPYVYKKSMNPKECCICLADFKERERIRKLHCNHEFHKKCVDKWLIKGEVCCPMCRKEPFEEKK